ncbi:superoxide dismutase family protein [Pseudobacillus badius]|uniref:superoxide dismutase family protein n=1 Tax=Bacillus badius TaxID=1455 RepID=UPI0025530C8F|nr:superoxide dismutase family protein [Bacillus badius]
MMKRLVIFSFLLAVALVIGACGGGKDKAADEQKENETTTESGSAAPEKEPSNETSTEKQAPESPDSPVAGDGEDNDAKTIDLKNSEGKKVGIAQLKQTDKGVSIQVEASDLPPGEHGFHLHETGKCDAPGFESAGGHFNPGKASHGMNHEKGPHAGDLPNLTVGKDGKVKAEMVAEHVTLNSGKAHSLFDEDGSALVIHEKADDGKSQPAGDAGTRIACGVISAQ